LWFYAFRGHWIASKLFFRHTRLNTAQKQVLKTWIAAGLWLFLIAGESSDLASAYNTSRILYPILHFLMGLDPTRFLVWHFYIRKLGHFVGYFILSLLLFRAWRATLRDVSLLRWSIQWASIAFFMATLVASFDEWHQTYLPSRTGALHDVLLDSAAALTAQIVMFLWLSFRNRRPPSVTETEMRRQSG
jgi:VanZ family protein